MALVITQAGLNKAIDASLQGISFKITHVGVGATGYVPDIEQDSLKNEITRLAISGGKKINSNQIHLTALFDGESEIIGREIGFYLEDGTLFAVDSDPDIIIMYKSGSNGSRALEAFDLILDSVPADSITVDVTGDLTLNFDKDFEEIKQFTIDELSKYSPTLKIQHAPLDAKRTYKTGEVCTIEAYGEVIAMQMYAGPNITCINKNPADLTNRHEQWADPTKPFWWIPYTGTEVGTPFWWLSETPPESAVMEINANLPSAVYWRLARCYPDLVKVVGSTEIINTGEIRGHFLRVLDQGRGFDANRHINSYQRDLLRQHGHAINNGTSVAFSDENSTSPYAVGSGSTRGDDYIRATSVTNAESGSETRPHNTARAMAITI